jgi:uncharacterized protein
MKRIKLKILGLSYSQSQIGSYVLVLSEIKGDRKLPIIIKSNDAQYIALKMEGIESPRPSTHDLFKSFTDALGGEINEIYIHSLTEGVFYTRVTLSNAMDSYDIECGIGDAVAMSIIYKCPIYASQSVLDMAGIYMTDDGQITDDQNKKNHRERKKETVSIESLEKMLEKAVEDEEFEIASQIRDRINKLKEVK